MDADCDLKALCAGHVTAHRGWGHVVTVQVGAGDAGDEQDVPGPGTMLGITHCPKPEHSGAEGLLSHQCQPCEVLLCRLCADEHLALGHQLLPLRVAAAQASSSIDAAIPALQAALAHQTALGTELRQKLATLAPNRDCTVAALAANTARLHAQVDALQALALAELSAAYDAKVAALESALKAARCSAGELATMAAAAEAAREPTCSPTTRVHVAQSVATTLPLASARPSIDVDVTLCFQGDSEVHAGAVGRLVTDKSQLQDGSVAIDAVSGQCYHEALRVSCMAFVSIPTCHRRS